VLEPPNEVRFPKRIRLSADAYDDRAATFHFTIRAHAEIRNFSDDTREAIWSTVLETTTAGRVDLLAACLMPDHLHLLLRPGTVGATAFISSFKSWTTRQSWRTGDRGALWQPGSWDRTMRNENDFRTTVAYVLENPVRAGLTEDWREWQWTWVTNIES